MRLGLTESAAAWRRPWERMLREAAARTEAAGAATVYGSHCHVHAVCGRAWVGIDRWVGPGEVRVTASDGAAETVCASIGDAVDVLVAWATGRGETPATARRAAAAAALDAWGEPDREPPPTATLTRMAAGWGGVHVYPVYYRTPRAHRGRYAAPLGDRPAIRVQLEYRVRPEDSAEMRCWVCRTEKDARALIGRIVADVTDGGHPWHSVTIMVTERWFAAFENVHTSCSGAPDEGWHFTDGAHGSLVGDWGDV